MCQACGDPAHDPDGGDDEEDDDEHECPWCGEPCACAFGPDPGEYDGEALDCRHECADDEDTSEPTVLRVPGRGPHVAGLSDGAPACARDGPNNP